MIGCECFQQSLSLWVQETAQYPLGNMLFGPTFPHQSQDMQQGEREVRGCRWSCQCFLSSQCNNCSVCSRQSLTGGTRTMVVSRHQLCPRSSYAWAVEFLMILVSVYLLSHGTRGFSVSRATPLAQASFFFFPGKDIRKKVTSPTFGILASFTWANSSESQLS